MAWFDINRWSIAKRINSIIWLLMGVLALIGVVGLGATLRMAHVTTEFDGKVELTRMSEQTTSALL